MELLIGLALGIYIGRWIQRLIDQWAMQSLLKDLGVSERELARVRDQLENNTDRATEEPQLEELAVKIEQHGDRLYAYRVDNDQFLGQGTDRESLLKSLTDNLTNVRITVKKEHGAEHIYP